MARKKAQPVEPEPAVSLYPALTADTVRQVAADIAKKFGKGQVTVLGEVGAYEDVRHVPTGIPELDAMFGIGGLPLDGKLVEIWGPESSGKTTLTRYLAARCQEVGVLPIFKAVAGEESAVQFDASLGVDLTRALGDSTIETMEDVFTRLLDEVPIVVKRKVPTVFFWDSIAATPMRAELEGDVDGTDVPGVRARFLAKNLKKLMAVVKDQAIGLVFVNQERERIGAMPFQQQTYSPGGRAVRHYASIRIRCTATGQIKQGDTVIGMKMRAKANKNKLAPPMKEANLEILWNPPTLRADETRAGR